DPGGRIPGPWARRATPRLAGYCTSPVGDNPNRQNGMRAGWTTLGICHDSTLANTRRTAHVTGPAARRGQAAVFRRRDRMAQLTAADGGRPEPEDRPRQLLDLHLHQLAPPAS